MAESPEAHQSRLLGQLSERLAPHRGGALPRPEKGEKMSEEQMEALWEAITDNIWINDMLDDFKRDETKYVMDYIEGAGDIALENQGIDSNFTCTSDDLEKLVEKVDSWARWRYS